MAEPYFQNSELPGDTLTRLRLYQPLFRLWKYKQKSDLTISIISESLGIPSSTVIKDLKFCPVWPGPPNDLPSVDILIDCIDVLLGQKEFKEALLIGAGKLGTSLLRNETIAGSGLKIVAAFDIDPDKVGRISWGIKVLGMEKLDVFVKQMHLKMAMIATTPENAVAAAQQAIYCGVQVIWNFTQTVIPEKEGVIVQNTFSSADIDQDYQKLLAKI